MEKLFDSLSVLSAREELYASDLSVTKNNITINKETYKTVLNNCDRIAFVFRDNILYLLPTERGFKVAFQSPKRVAISISKDHPPVGYYEYTGIHKEDEHIFHKFELKP